jgi:hypothetical protein
VFFSADSRVDWAFYVSQFLPLCDAEREAGMSQASMKLTITFNVGIENVVEVENVQLLHTWLTVNVID